MRVSSPRRRWGAWERRAKSPTSACSSRAMSRPSSRAANSSSMAAISRNNIFGERNLGMTEAPKTSAALPALVVVSGTASGLGTHIARQLVDCGVATIGVDIAPQPKALEHKLYRHAQGDVAEEKVWAAVITEINKAAPNTIGLITSAAILEVGTIIEF